MSAVIKSGEQGRDSAVRSFLAAPESPSLSPQDQRIEDLEQQLTAATDQLATLRREEALFADRLKLARAESFEAGVAEGAKTAEDQSAALRQSIDEAAARAADAFTTSMSALHTLAGDLAGLALSQIVGDISSRRALVVETVQRAATALTNDVEIVIQVSAEDFPPSEARCSAQDIFPHHRIEVHEKLASGECRIRMVIGEVDLGLAGQVERLRVFLRDAENITS